VGVAHGGGGGNSRGIGVYFCLGLAFVGRIRGKDVKVVYTIEQLRDRIAPVARKYGLPTVYIFGSYARGEATDASDVDILVDKTGTQIRGLFAMGGLYNDLREAIGKPIDLITTDALAQDSTRQRTPWIIDNLNNERVRIYEQR
jgi:predicted nucleotidyltransferase